MQVWKGMKRWKRTRSRRFGHGGYVSVLSMATSRRSAPGVFVSTRHIGSHSASRCVKLTMTRAPGVFMSRCCIKSYSLTKYIAAPIRRSRRCASRVFVSRYCTRSYLCRCIVAPMSRSRSALLEFLCLDVAPGCTRCLDVRAHWLRDPGGDSWSFCAYTLYVPGQTGYL